MPDRRRFDPLVFAFLVTAAAFLPMTYACAATFEGRVIGIADGDSLTVLDAGSRQHEVRLAAIDAPEARQPFGQRAKQLLASLVFRKRVRVEWERLDRYDRRNGKVWVVPPDHACRSHECPKTLDVGLYMLSAGLAWHYKRYEHEQPLEERERYAHAERQARARRAGLWAFSRPVPPWQWRVRMQDRVYHGMRTHPGR